MKYANIVHGMMAGVVAAGVFGIMMILMTPDTLGKIAALYGGSTDVVGFCLHIIHGALIGGLFGVLTDSHISSGKSSWYGIIYGAVWWVAGPLLLMPTFLGAGPRLSLEGASAALPSLWGHLVFGLILGYLFVELARNARAHETKEA